MLPKSRYLEYFIAHQERIKESAALIGDICLIEAIKFPAETRRPSGIILTDDRKTFNGIGSDRPSFFRVLLPGNGYFDETTKETVPLESQPGDIILVGTVSAKMFSTFPLLEAYEPDTIGITREADIQIRFKGEESFGRFLGELDSHVKAQVAAEKSQ